MYNNFTLWTFQSFLQIFLLIINTDSDHTAAEWMSEGLSWILLTPTADLTQPTCEMCHGPRKSIQLAYPGRKDTSGCLIWGVDNTFLHSFLWSGELVLGKDEVFPAVAQEGFCLWTRWKLCVLCSFTSVHRLTLVTLFQNLPLEFVLEGHRGPAFCTRSLG